MLWIRNLCHISPAVKENEAQEYISTIIIIWQENKSENEIFKISNPQQIGNH